MYLKSGSLSDVDRQLRCLTVYQAQYFLLDPGNTSSWPWNGQAWERTECPNTDNYGKKAVFFQEFS